MQGTGQRLVGEEEMTVATCGSLEPASPGFPSFLGNGLQEAIVLASFCGQKESALAHQTPVFAEPSLHVGGCGFVHPDVENHGSLGWRGGRYGRHHDRISIVSDGSTALVGAALTSSP